jgi:predicted ATPase
MPGDVQPAQPDNLANLEADVSSLYRSTFVGRDSELRQLQILFDNAVAGQSALVAVLGEPGIGKTSLCEQLASYATGHGARVLIGHCYEEGSLSLPYLPFVEALRGYILDRDPAALRSELRGGADGVARIVPNLHEQLAIEPRPSGDPEYERWRLLQSVSEFLRSASLAQVLVLVLEDLHDADRATLDLLVHLSRNLQGSRLLVLGTYRDVEVDRTHPLSAALAELRRSSQFLRLALRGLTESEVQRMLGSISGQEVPAHLVELVHRQTEGNPLFVQELMRYLLERGLVGSREGALQRVSVDSCRSISPRGSGM